MKPSIEKIDLGEQQSLVVRHLTMPYFDAPYHFHPEYELTYIVQGYGQRFVGDTVEPFRAGDFVLLGPGLAHYWRSNSDFYKNRLEVVCESIVIQFPPKLVEQLLGPFPEFSNLLVLLGQAGRGVVFESRRPPGIPSMEAFLFDLCLAPPTARLLLFLQLMHQLALWSPTRLLTGENYVPRSSDAETNRMGRVLDYSMLHFKSPITLGEIAGVAHLSEAAFCRYFRKRTRKTYFTYLNELRISHARQLLIESGMSVSQVALEAGFKNLPYFHRLFLKHTQYSPLNFRRLYQE